MHFKIHGDKPVPGELVLLAKQHAAQNRNAEAGELRIVATVDDDGFRLHATTSYFPGTYYNVTRHCSASLQFGRWYQVRLRSTQCCVRYVSGRWGFVDTCICSPVVLVTCSFIIHYVVSSRLSFSLFSHLELYSMAPSPYLSSLFVALRDSWSRW